MHRSGFKPKKPVKRIIAEYRKTPKKGWQPPSWISVIPLGSHGSNPIQKKLWKLTSDCLRIKDYYAYGGVCPGCKQFKFHTWKDGDCGHWKSWGASSSYEKYQMLNLALICKNCNNNENGQIGYRFGEELKRRYGDDVLDNIEQFNIDRRGQKMENIYLVGVMEVIIEMMRELPEKPDYWDKLITKYEERNQTI